MIYLNFYIIDSHTISDSVKKKTLLYSSVHFGSSSVQVYKSLTYRLDWIILIIGLIYNNN